MKYLEPTVGISRNITIRYLSAASAGTLHFLQQNRSCEIHISTKTGMTPRPCGSLAPLLGRVSRVSGIGREITIANVQSEVDPTVESHCDHGTLSYRHIRLTIFLTGHILCSYCFN